MEKSWLDGLSLWKTINGNNEFDRVSLQTYYIAIRDGLPDKDISGAVWRVQSGGRPPSAHSPRASLRLQDLISAGNGRPPLDLLQPSGARRARTRDAIGARGGQSGSAWRLRDRGR